MMSTAFSQITPLQWPCLQIISCTLWEWWRWCCGHQGHLQWLGGNQSACSAWDYLHGYSSSSHSSSSVRVKSGSWALITHPAAQSVSPGVRSGWLCVTEEDSSAMGRNMMEFIPICFLFVNGRIFTSACFRNQDLSFVKCLQLLCLWIWKRWCRRGDFDPTLWMKGGVSMNRDNV